HAFRLRPGADRIAPKRARRLRVAEWVRVARLSEIPEGGLKGVKAKGKEICLANIDGEAYAVSDRCPHLRYHLHNGKVQGTVLECPGHGAKFDLIDGGVC